MSYDDLLRKNPPVKIIGQGWCAQKSSHNWPYVLTTLRRVLRTHGISPSGSILVIDVCSQRLIWLQKEPRPCNARRCTCLYRLRGLYRVSTSQYGIGQVAGSFKTPIGLHRIYGKFGAGWPPGVVLEARKPVGLVWKTHPDGKILHRAMWLEGLQDGLNRGGECDSLSRYIYIHGTADEHLLGRPASKGCIHLDSQAVITLSDALPVGTLIWIDSGPVPLRKLYIV